MEESFMAQWEGRRAAASADGPAVRSYQDWRPRAPVDLANRLVFNRSMSFDITQLLDQWDFEPGQVSVRKFKSKDGAEKLQLRVDLGLLQMNAQGRPDGKRPFGRESLMDHQEARLEKHRQDHGGSEDGFALQAADCAKLQQECIQYHHRYICLFQLEDYHGVISDTDRNLKAFDFVKRHAASSELSWALQQFRPQLLLMRARAKGQLALQAGSYDEVFNTVESSIQELRSFYNENHRFDLLEQSDEIRSLEAWREEIRANRPRSEREKLESALDEAVRKENYEEAAKVRDQLRNLKPVRSSPQP
jgi:UvrB/UvrC motif-containing protein